MTSGGHRVLVLDVGDVLIETRPDRVIEQLCTLDGVTRYSALSAVADAELVDSYETGRLDTAGFFAALADLLGAAVPWPSRLESAWQALVGDLHSEIAGACRDRRAGTRVVFASNTNPSHWTVIRPMLAAGGLAHVPHFLSYVVGVRKPAPEFYRRLAKEFRASCDGGLLVIDDQEANLAAAGRVGMPTYLHDCADATARVIRDFLSGGKPP